MDVTRTCNLTVRFSKFTLNINIYDEFVGFLSKLVWRETLLFLDWKNLETRVKARVGVTKVTELRKNILKWKA